MSEVSRVAPPSASSLAGGGRPQSLAPHTSSPATAGGGNSSPNDKTADPAPNLPPQHLPATSSPTTTAELPPAHISEQATQCGPHQQIWEAAIRSQLLECRGDHIIALLNQVAKEDAPIQVTQHSVSLRIGAAQHTLKMGAAKIEVSDNDSHRIAARILQYYQQQTPSFTPLAPFGFQAIPDIPLTRDNSIDSFNIALSDEARDAAAISVVLGPSGSGKTTVMAQLLPRYVVKYTTSSTTVEEENWGRKESGLRPGFVRIILLSEVLTALKTDGAAVSTTNLGTALWNHVSKTIPVFPCNLVLAIDEAGVSPSLFEKGDHLKTIYGAVKIAAEGKVVGLHLAVGGTGLATSLGNVGSNTPGIIKLRLGPWKEEHIKAFLGEKHARLLLSSPLLGKVATNPRMLKAIKDTLSVVDRWDGTPTGQLVLARIAMSRYRAQNCLHSVEQYDTAGQTGLLRGVAACALRAAMFQPATFNPEAFRRSTRAEKELSFHEHWATHCGLVDDMAEVADVAGGDRPRFEMSPAIVVLCADMMGLELDNLVHNWDSYEQLVVLHDALLLAASSQGQKAPQILSGGVLQPLPALLEGKEFPYCPPIHVVVLEGGAPQNSVKIPVKVKGSDEAMLVVRNGPLGGAADSYSPWRISQHKYGKEPVYLVAELAKMGVLKGSSTDSEPICDKTMSTAAQRAFVDNWLALWARRYPQSDDADPGGVVLGLKNHKSNMQQYIGQRKMYPTQQLVASDAKRRTEFVTALWGPRIALNNVFSQALDEMDNQSEDANSQKRQQTETASPDTVENKKASVQEPMSTQPFPGHARRSALPGATLQTAPAEVLWRAPVLELCFALGEPAKISTGLGACIRTSQDETGDKTRVVMERSIIAVCEKEDTRWAVDLSITNATGTDYVRLLKEELESLLRVDLDVATIVVRFACAELSATSGGS